MSGLVKWTSRAKRKTAKKGASSKPNAQRQRMLAARKRKIRLSAAKASRKLAQAGINQ